MPELPEVETMRRGIASIVGQQIAQVSLPPCTRRPIQITPPFPEFEHRLRQRTIENVGRKGKRILLELDDHSVVVIEPRMTGLVLLTDPPSQEHLRLQVKFQVSDSNTRSELLFWDRRGLGTVRWLSAEQIPEVLGDQKIGPDALAIDLDSLRIRFMTSKREIKVALLDQRAVAGIGNLYASEILFRAGIDPRTPCNRLTLPQWARLYRATQAILETAIRYEGSTLSDGTYRNALNSPGGYQNHHSVYDRAGQKCTRCPAGMITRIVQGGRSTFYCSVCQTRRGIHAALKTTVN